jgi:hypothetical protein
MMVWSKSASSRAIAVGVLMGLPLFFSLGQAGAQNRRDPTLPPAQSGVAGAASSGKFLSVDTGALSIIVRDGRPYLAVGMRLYSQGERLGKARIERISETEVWFREGGVLYKVPRFAGIQRRASTAVAAKPECTASSKKSSLAANCANVQP